MTDQVAPESMDYGKVAALCFIAAVILVAIGFYTMYTYDSSSYGSGAGRLVQGDAYNYAIIATRGVGWMVAGVVAALLGVGAMLAREVQ